MGITHYRVSAWACGIALIAASATSWAATDPGDKCEATKNGLVGGYVACMAKAKAKLVAGGGTETDIYLAAVAKCQEKLNERWTKAEEKAAGACPDQAGTAAVEDFISACLADVQDAVAGNGAPSDYAPCNADVGTCNTDVGTCQNDLAACATVNCGNGFADAGELCDGADLNGATCATQSPSTPYGTLACSGGCNGFVTSGCSDRFDSSGATIIDYATGLEWQKKFSPDATPDLNNPHDSDNTYTWTTGTSAATGSVFTDMLGRLNGAYGGGCYDGHCDWRLPTLAELQSTALACGTPPCVVYYAFSLVVSGASDQYWSSTTDAGNNTRAGRLTYFDGSTGTDPKTTAHHAIAVRTR